MQIIKAVISNLGYFNIRPILNLSRCNVNQNNAKQLKIISQNAINHINIE